MKPSSFGAGLVEATTRPVERSLEPGDVIINIAPTVASLGLLARFKTINAAFSRAKMDVLDRYCRKHNQGKRGDGRNFIRGKA